MLLLLREVYHLPLRGLQGFISSLFSFMGVRLPVPCYSQICRRAKHMKKALKRYKKRSAIDLVFDSTGLKVYGEGEWKVRKHGAGKRRTWKKLHLGIDLSTQEIVVAELTDRDGGDAATAEKMLDKIKAPLGQVLEPVQNLFKIKTTKARTAMCRLEFNFLSQFFHNLRHFSSHAKDLSTTHLLGRTLKVCSSLLLATVTSHPSKSRTELAKFFPV